MNVYGLGAFARGRFRDRRKSECALELLKRGHMLVADDVGRSEAAPGRGALWHGSRELIRHHMELRGVGIIDVQKIFRGGQRAGPDAHRARHSAGRMEADGGVRPGWAL